jgi:predicted dehydrogenase
MMISSCAGKLALQQCELTNVLIFVMHTATSIETFIQSPAEALRHEITRVLQVAMSTTSQPLRTALIGLSSSATTSWAAKAHLPGLIAEAGQSRFAIRALLNSSLGAARSAIDVYKLPTDTKAYGSPDALAADPDIDLVICNTRVDKHYETIIPSIRAGKDVFVEWPIAAKTEHIQELVETAKQSGSRVAVGLQRRWNPVITKVRQLISHDQTLGKVLSLEIRMFGGSLDREILPTGLKYFAQREVGGNPIVIGVGHGKWSTLYFRLGELIKNSA